MSQELRIRDSYPGQGWHGEHGEDSRFRDEGPPADPGEVAWDLAEPSFDLTPGSDEPEERDEEREPFPGFPGFPGMGGEEDEPPAKSPGLDIDRLARGILKRFWLATGIAFAIASLFLGAALTLIKPKWEAAASVVLHTRQDQFSLGGAKPFELQSYNLKTLLDTIKLPNSLLAVAEALKLEVAPRTLSAAIGVNLGKDSNIFQITTTWNDPVVAASIANKVAELLVQRSRDIRHTEAADALANYSAQLDAARQDLRTVTADMRAFKDSHQVSDLNAETQVLLGSLSTLEADLNTKTGEAQAYRETLAEIEKAVKSEPAMVVASTVYRNPLKNRLSDYEWQLQEARSRYTEQNPKVIKLQTRVDVLKQMIAESKDEGAPENLYAPNAKLTELQARQREIADNIRVHEAQIAALTESIEQSRTKLATLIAAEKDYQLLQTRLTSAENLVAGLVGRVNEAEVLMRRNEATVELYEAARPPTEAAPSKKKLIAIAGVVLGGGIGLGVALMLELLDPLLRTRRDALGIAGVALAWEFQQVPAQEHAAIRSHLPADPVADLFRRLINELDTKLEPKDWRCLGVLSAEPAAGRTLIAVNLAQALALKEYSTILVDADLRRLTGLHPADLLGLPADQPGLFQALSGGAPLGSLLTSTPTPNLALLPAGHLPTDLAPVDPDDAATQLEGQSDQAPGLSPDPHLAGLGTRQFGAIFDTLRQTQRHLIYDLPPLDTQETVLEAAAALGSLLLVARSGRTTRQELRESVERLEERGAKVLGILVTDVPFELLDGRPLFRPEPQKKTRLRWLRRSKPHAPHPQPEPESHVR